MENINIKKIFISPGHDFYGRYGKERLNHGIESVDEIDCVAGKGIRGDRFFDYREDFKGQITFFNWEVYEAMKEKFNVPDLAPSAFRRNVLVSGIDLNSLIGKEFEIQGIRFSGSEHCAPCEWMDVSVAQGAKDALENQAGLRARILTNGTLRINTQ